MSDQPSSMLRFLQKLKELVWDKLSQSEKDDFQRIAAGHAGGMARAEKMKAEKESQAAQAEPGQAADPKGFPYSRLEALPEAVRTALPEPAQKIWMGAFNAMIGQNPADEGRAARIAWAAVKKFGWEQKDGRWVRAGEMPDEAVMLAALEASSMNGWHFLAEVALAEDGASGSVQIFPAVGSYKHPRYGEMRITTEFLSRVKANFDARIYQQELPLTIDLEHQSNLSGAAGWVKGLEVRGDKGMWAQIEFNERGKSLVGADAYRYFSPEFYDAWTDPATSKAYQDVLIGGALTNHPFFKGMSAVVMAAEGVFALGEVPTTWVEVMKTEDGEQYPAEAFLYCPDPAKPSEWKLRVWETRAAKATRAQLGRAAAALGPGGFRGQAVQLPAADRPAVLAKLRGLYAQLGAKPDEMPAQIRASLSDAGVSEADAGAVLVEIGLTKANEGGNHMGEEESKRLSELEASVKALREQLTASDTGRQKAESEARTAAERVAGMERADQRRRFSEFVRDHRLAFQCETDQAVDHLEKIGKQLSEADFGEYLAERKLWHEQMRQSALFSQASGPGIPAGAASEFEAAVNAKIAKEPGLSKADATARVASENPSLYNRFDREHKARARRGGD